MKFNLRQIKQRWLRRLVLCLSIPIFEFIVFLSAIYDSSSEFCKNFAMTQKEIWEIIKEGWEY